MSALARTGRSAFLALTVLVLAAPPPAAADLLDDLRAAPGVSSAVEQTARIPGTRFFWLTFDQPVDHRDPGGARFSQFVSLSVRSAAAPVVLATTGYSGPRRQVEIEASAVLGANLVFVEHRYFFRSTPQPLDWRFLDIAQAAGDHHRIVQALRPLLPARWISTGGSKGGMTSVYHRVFYPSDVDGTVAYVAPQSYGTFDPRYVRFVDQVGDAGCRQALRLFQRELLGRRGEMLDRLTTDALFYGDTFERLGIDRAFEFAVVEAPFVFWQYGDAANCALIPPPAAASAEIYDFLDLIYGGPGGVLFSWGDSTLDFFAPYYYQAATELGGPAVGYAHLLDLAHYPFQDVPAVFPPIGVEKRFHPLVMPFVQLSLWLRVPRVMFVYGGNDPWSAGAFLVNPRKEQSRHFVAGGNHGSAIFDLPAAEQAEAYATLASWAGVAPAARATAPTARGAAAEPAFDRNALLVRRTLRR